MIRQIATKVIPTMASTPQPENVSPLSSGRSHEVVPF